MAKTTTPVSISDTNTLNVSAITPSTLPKRHRRQPPISRMNSEAYRGQQDKRRKVAQDAISHQQGSGHVPYSYGELLAMDFKPAPWLLTGLIRVNEVFMTYAGTGVGKTWFTLSMAMVAAGGGQLLDWTNDTPKRVLYLDGEMDAGELVGRMKQLAAGLKCDPEALSTNFVLCSRQMQKSILGNFIEIETEESQFGILDYAQEQKFDVIVIDNLTTLSGQIDENASKDLKQFNTFLLRAKQLGIAVLVVHHQGKGKDSGPRGSTAMIATLNLLLKLEPSTQEREAGDKDARFTIVFEKTRGSIDSRPLPVVITTASFDDEFSPNQTVESGDPSPLVLMIDPDADSNAERAKKLLQTGKYKTQGELAKAFGVKQPAMSKILTKAVAQGVLSKDAVSGYYQRARDAGDISMESAEQETEDF
jgi:hypothetical protein